jgi:aubergine-like protein
VVTKIAVQMNCKMGGAAWSIASPIRDPLVMVVGLDVCHDTQRGSQSVVGFTATMDPGFTQYFSKIAIQPAGQEPVNAIQTCMGEALVRFRGYNGGSLPTTIIVYRDGVGDGQLQMVNEFEVPQIAQVLKSVGGAGYAPGLAVIVVKKRIHTRIFGGDAARLTNPTHGTVVDRGVTHMNWYDFFLVSQSVKEGTVTPTHYHVIFDNTRLEAHQLQQLTYKLCHMYYNWSGTIRVPAPCQYAHKNAFLNGQHVHRNVLPKNEDKLFYL